MLVLAHGYGSNEQDLFGLAQYLDDRFLIVSVRAPQPIGPSAYGWYPLAFTPSGITHLPAEARDGTEALSRAIDELVTAYASDPRRVYLAGFSQGGIISLAVTLMQPTKVAGVVVMSGMLLPEARQNAAPADSLKGLPIFVAHGKWDDVIPVEKGREIQQELADLPVDIVYREYPMGHQISAESLADITEWLSDRLDAGC